MTVKEIISQALAEDLGDGDHSSLSSIPADAHGGAILIAKERGILAGIDIARQVFQQVDSTTIFHALASDGDEVFPGDMVFTVEGKSISILSGERVALNFIQRMSGIASRTHHLVSLLNGLSTKLLDTRKTTPLLRELEKYAVRVGGGQNHRFGLFDMIMLKDNHIDFAGGIEKAILKAVDYIDSTGKDLRIEVETRNIEEVREVLRVGKIHRIMFDNFKVEEMKEAVALVGGRFETEASGGITEQTLLAYAETGVDFISVGALTHHIKSLDLSLKAIKD